MKKIFLLLTLFLLSFSVCSQNLDKLSKDAEKYAEKEDYVNCIKTCELILSSKKTDLNTLKYKIFAGRLSFEYSRIQDDLKEKIKAYQFGETTLTLIGKVLQLDPDYVNANISMIPEIRNRMEKLLKENPNINSQVAESSKQNEVSNKTVENTNTESNDKTVTITDTESTKTNTENQIQSVTNTDQNIKKDTAVTEVKPNTDKTVTITVSGSGKTQDEAKQSALRSAIEQAFGAFISAKTEILNDQVVSDQITSVANGNIKSFDILNDSQLPDGDWGVTLKALVSIDKLTRFVEAKGVSVEINGGLFAQNIKQQILNEQGEIKAISELVELLYEPMQTAFDYSIISSDPKSVDTENKNWEIPLTVIVTANNNMDICAEYCIRTLSAISMSTEEVTSYNTLNKEVFTIIINHYGVEYKTFYLRKKTSLNVLNILANQFRFYVSLFTIESGIDEINGNLENLEMNFKPLDGNTITFLKAGEKAGIFTWKDKRTLAQIEKMSGYKVKPKGVITSTVVDIDGNLYHTITYGTKVWMLENFKSTKYNDNTLIPNVMDNTVWSALKSGAYCDYDNIPSNSITSGRLYNWYAINTGKLAPKGWHVASKEEWSTLIDLFGEKLNHNIGFSVFRSGVRDNDASFYDTDDYCCYWSATEGGEGAWKFNINKYLEFEKYTITKGYGFSVRCVKD